MIFFANINKNESELEMGEYEGDLPDLIIRWSKASSASIASLRLEKAESIYYSRKGDHNISMKGMFLAIGPHVIPDVLNEKVNMKTLVQA